MHIALPIFIGVEKMKQEKLQEFVENVSVRYFKKPFLHRAIFNPRLRTTGGRYHLDTHHLDFNPKILDGFGLEVFEGIIKHELCHYHLHLTGKGYKHGDMEFKQLLEEVGALRYTPSLELKQDKVTRWEYQCKDCRQKLYRKRRFNATKYICAKCQSRFDLKGQKELTIE